MILYAFMNIYNTVRANSIELIIFFFDTQIAPNSHTAVLSIEKTSAHKLLNQETTQDASEDHSSAGGYAYNNSDESSPLPTTPIVNNNVTAADDSPSSIAGYSYNSSEIDGVPKAVNVVTTPAHQSSQPAQGYSYNADGDSNSSYVDNTQHDSKDMDEQPVSTEQSSVGYSYVDNSQHEDTQQSTEKKYDKANNSCDNNDCTTVAPSGYSYEHEYVSNNSADSERGENANYHLSKNAKNSTEQTQSDGLKKHSPAITTTPTSVPMTDLKNWTIDYFSLQNKYVLLSYFAAQIYCLIFFAGCITKSLIPKVQ